MNTAKTLCSTILLTGTALLACGAGAADLEIERRVVSFDDLNLNNAAGIETLYGRIRAAARSVCGSFELMQPLMLDANRECARASLDDAVARVDHPDLTAYHLHKTRAGSPERMAARPRA